MKNLKLHSSIGLFFIVCFVCAGYVWAQECTLEPMDGRTIVQLGPEGLCSPEYCGSYGGQSELVNITPSIPSGIYDITLESYDDHSNKPTQEQLNESYFLQLNNETGDKIIDTNVIDDLPNDKDTKVQLVNTGLFIGKNIGSIQAIHYCDDSTGNNCESGPNSIVPVCVAFDTLTGGDGCTPGYWKQEHHFWAWTEPFTPDTLFSDVFEDAFPGMNLLQVLDQGGGGLYALGRHTVAALLNAASHNTDYDLTVQEIINSFNGAFPGIEDDYEALKLFFEDFNEQGCPLGNNKDEIDGNGDNGNGTIPPSSDGEGCTIEPMDGRTIIQLGPEGLCSPEYCGSYGGQSELVNITPSIPSGVYDITLESYDDHSNKPTQEQLNESYFLQLNNETGDKIIDTNAIDDLPNDKDTKVQLVNTGLFIGKSIGSIQAIHYCDDSTGNNCESGPNSIVPVCVAFDTLTGGDGCTPGYWKQDHHFWAWTEPFTPDTLFSDVFENAFPGMSLLEVLKQGGGGLNALGRHTVAALLNASSPNTSYDLTIADVIASFNNVYPASKSEYNSQKDIFQDFNEQGCPLGNNKDEIEENGQLEANTMGIENDVTNANDFPVTKGGNGTGSCFISSLYK